MTISLSDKSKLAVKRFGISIVLTMLIAVSASQLICFMLGILSYQKNSKEIFRSKYVIVQKNIIRDIEGSLRFGKDLKTFYGLEKQLSGVMQVHKELLNIVVYSDARQVLWDMSGVGIRTHGKVPDEGWLTEIFGNTHIFSPIKSAGGDVSGYIDFVVSNGPVNTNVISVAKWAAQNMLIIILVSVLAMMAALGLAGGKGKSGHLNKKWISVTLIILVVVTQFFSLYLISAKLVSQYQRNARDNAAFIEGALGAEVEMLMSKGVRISRLIGLDQMMQQIALDIPEIASIGIMGPDGSVLYTTAGNTKKTDSARPLVKSGETVGFIDAVVSQEYVDQFSKKLLYDGLTTFVISLMFATELLIFLFAYTTHRRSKTAGKTGRRYNGFMRTAAASYLFGATLAISFIPLYVGTLEKTTGVLDDFTSLLSSLPVSVELFCTIPMIILAGVWMDRRGWHEPFITGCGLPLSVPQSQEAFQTRHRLFLPGELPEQVTAWHGHQQSPLFYSIRMRQTGRRPPHRWWRGSLPVIFQAVPWVPCLRTASGSGRFSLLPFCCCLYPYFFPWPLCGIFS